MVEKVGRVNSETLKLDNKISNSTASFREIFESRLNAEHINLSKHAQERILLRGIEVGKEEIDGINKAIDLASSKGVRDSLVMINGKAFVVNIPSRTVVTAIEEGGLKNRIFTNIDGVVIL
ncbi:MAG: TIGR02530 family flagellar biosynthesis protein [bacterium]